MKSHLKALFTGENNDENPIKTSERTVSLTLKIAPELEDFVGPERRYSLAFFENALPDIQENQLSVHGIELEKDIMGVRVIGMFRNGLSLPVGLKSIPLQLRDASGEVTAHHVFKIEGLEDIPPRTALVTTWVFPYSSFIKKDVDFTDWSIDFALSLQ
jgi:SLAP domain-containing protein